MKKHLFGLLAVVVWPVLVQAATPTEFRVGTAGHAFDHLGNIGEQAAAATDSGATIIYATGLGSVGYAGLPSTEKLAELRKTTIDYNRQARSKGIKRILGYVCATSIVKLEPFDDNWTQELKSRFQTPPSQWLQVGRDGKALPSWYGGEYHPACMNHPDWQSYEKFMVRQQLESGHDGIFFDNPTVHPQGCYCRYCMGKFAAWLNEQGIDVLDISLDSTRRLAEKHPKEFMRYRATIARDFLMEMRKFARTVRRDAFVTCNNSLNSPDALFSQSRTYGYNIYELSKAEDLVVVEDMKSQPRRLAGGGTVEYGSTFRLLQSISREKPVVAVAIADGDYHTPPRLVRLAMAEAAAHGASHLWWPTWPEKERTRMAKIIRPQAEFLRRHDNFLNDTTPRSDVMLFFPFRRWVDGDRCAPAEMAAALTRLNIQYAVVAEDAMVQVLKKSITRAQVVGSGRGSSVSVAGRLTLPVLLIESLPGLTPEERNVIDEFEANGGRVLTADEPDWLKKVQTWQIPSLGAPADPTLRVVMQDKIKQTIVHVYNLGVERVSSFEDKVYPVSSVPLKIRVPARRVISVQAFSPEEAVDGVRVPFKTRMEKAGLWVDLTLPRLEIATILVIDY